MKKTLEKAAQTGTKINLMYISRSGTVSKRVIYIISYTNERIVGYCYMRRSIRTFNIKNILAVEQIEQKMEAYV